MPEFEELCFHNGPVELRAKVAGPESGPLVILLHGFPEFWYSWHRQMAPLAAAGYRVIVPDLRGYNASSKPGGVNAYAIEHLVSDVIAIADKLGCGKFCLAGHDWGAAIAWSVAAEHPGRVASLAILNVPHPATMARFLKTRLRQLLHSWYIIWFQIPLIPEMVMAADDYRMAKLSLTGSSRPGTFTEADLRLYRDAWAQPGALTAMINWYRAAFRSMIRGGIPPTRIEVPVRIIWGEKDAFLIPEMAGDSLRYCLQGELIILPDASHWVQHEEPARVSELLIDWFGK